MQKTRHQKNIFSPCSLFDRCMVSPHPADTTTFIRSINAVSTGTYLPSTLPEAKWIMFALPPVNLDRQTCGWSHLGALYSSTSHAVKNGFFLASRCLTTVNVPYSGSGMATLLICESPPCPCCFSSWDPWIRGTCWFLLLHHIPLFQTTPSLFPKGWPLSAGGRQGLLPLWNHRVWTKDCEELEWDHQILLIYLGFEPRSSGWKWVH